MSEQEAQMVVFALKSNDDICEYGVPITQVQEIIRFTNLTRLPKAPSFVEGVINLRGKVIPIIDLKKRFDIESGTYTDDTRIIVVEIGGQTVGIIVDAVTEVLRIPYSSIEPPPAIIGGVAAEFLKGVGKIDDRLLVLLDLNKILSESEEEDLKTVEVA